MIAAISDPHAMLAEADPYQQDDDDPGIYDAGWPDWNADPNRWAHEKAVEFVGLPRAEKQTFLTDPERHLEGVDSGCRAIIAHHVAALARTLEDLAIAAALTPQRYRRRPTRAVVQRLALAHKVACAKEAETKRTGYRREPRRRRVRVRRSSSGGTKDPPPNRSTAGISADRTSKMSAASSGTSVHLVAVGEVGR